MRPGRAALLVALGGLSACGCGAGSPGPAPASTRLRVPPRQAYTYPAPVDTTAAAGAATPRVAQPATSTSAPTAARTPASAAPRTPASASAATPAAVPAPGSTSAAASHTATSIASASRRPLAGVVVGIDPGHNGASYTDPSFINHLIWNGRARETCDTTGTETDGGYTEARFNWTVASDLTTILRTDGAKVVLTRTSNDGIGPCVTTRAQIIDRAHADIAIDIHADGGPATGRGFAILEPVADGPNDAVIGSSQRFAHDLLHSFEAGTGMPTSTYDGSGGLVHRDDLAGLNLTTVPKVLIECANMRNATDAALLVSPLFQHRAARAMAAAITKFLAASRRVAG